MRWRQSVESEIPFKRFQTAFVNALKQGRRLGIGDAIGGEAPGPGDVRLVITNSADLQRRPVIRHRKRPFSDRVAVGARLVVEGFQAFGDGRSVFGFQLANAPAFGRLAADNER